MIIKWCGKTETVLNVMILLSGVTMSANCQLYNPNMGIQLYNETDRQTDTYTRL